jgi:hypothetical protein
MKTSFIICSLLNTSCTNRFNIQQLHGLPTLYLCVFFIYLRTNSDFFPPIHHKLIGIYNQGKKCLQRGTDWIFEYSSLRFVCKRLILL